MSKISEMSVAHCVAANCTASYSNDVIVTQTEMGGVWRKILCSNNHTHRSTPAVQTMVELRFTHTQPLELNLKLSVVNCEAVNRSSEANRPVRSELRSDGELYICNTNAEPHLVLDTTLHLTKRLGGGRYDYGDVDGTLLYCGDKLIGEEYGKRREYYVSALLECVSAEIGMLRNN